MPRRSREQAATTRAAVLERAAALGSSEGLEALSIGRLATELGLSKSGVIGHFGSKQALQLATVDAAIRTFRDAVWVPLSEEPGGLARLRALMASWLSYLEREVFPGGCFLTAASIEFDDRPGPVRDAIAAAWRLWLDVIEREVAAAQAHGQLAASAASPRQIAFELHAYVTAGNVAKQLFRDSEALAASRVAIERLLARSSAPHPL
ncbi:MAG: TetR/AcrR family transcriptional regulator [Solirubrobacteraceae bacterium]